MQKLDCFPNGEFMLTQGKMDSLMDGAMYLSSNDLILQWLFILQMNIVQGGKKPDVFIPYMPYMRQDDPDKELPLAKAFAKLLSPLVSSITTFDLHSRQAPLFFDCPVRNISPNKMITQHILPKIGTSSLVLSSTDFGGVKKVSDIAEANGLGVCYVEKKRIDAGKSKIVNIIGESVKGRKVLIIDDIADSCNTICDVAEHYKEQGATEVYVYFSHAVLSKTERILKCLKDGVIQKIYTTSSILSIYESEFAKECGDKLIINSISNINKLT